MSDDNVVLLKRDWADETATELMSLFAMPGVTPALVHRALAARLRLIEAEGSSRGIKEASDAYANLFKATP